MNRKTRERLTAADKIRIILAEPFSSREERLAVLVLIAQFLQKVRAETLAAEAAVSENFYTDQRERELLSEPESQR